MTLVRKTRLETILDVLWNCGGAGGCTRREIAESLGLKKSPYINSLLDQVVADGWASQEMDLTTWPHRLRYKPSQKLNEWHADRQQNAVPA